MTRRDRKRLSIHPAPSATANVAKERDAEKFPSPPAEDSPADTSAALAPFMPTQGESFGNADMQTGAGPNAGVEQIGASPPEQIDPGAGGKLVI